MARMAPGLATGVELGEHLLLDRHVLEHRLDDQVAVGEIGIVGGAVEQGEPRAPGVLGSGEPRETETA